MLVDGEHHPDVVRSALADLAGRGVRPVAVLYLGGTEKVGRYGAPVDLPVPCEWVPAGGGTDAMAASLTALIAGERPDVVVDLSDEPVVDGRRRMALASHALHAGVPYEGPDFAFRPPPRPRLADRPSVAVVGTGKRAGKTAVAGAFVRRMQATGHRPVVVAMGRGGPSGPVLVPAGAGLDAAALVRIADAGGHAASDFYEDAVTTGAATVGARRCGGGLAGAVGVSNMAAALRVAADVPGDLLVLEGSGAAVPPAHADAHVLVVPARADPEIIGGYLGPYRVLLADLIVVTMCEPSAAARAPADEMVEVIGRISRSTPLLRTVFRPYPLAPVDGARVFFATTAPAAATATLVTSLEQDHGCEVVATSVDLANRPALRRDLQAAPPFDVLLVELKAAAVDVAARYVASAGAKVVFCDNRLRVAGSPEDEGAAWYEAADRLARLAGKRFAAHDARR